ncbi:tetratricopeptide repeat protein [Acinetobacter sp. WZC-1]|uniref:tetratricopeptide repeat protein n=1 Tax=Acinetobacter sp. WZC-1 TaxID=3459034 RepID=UPI00403E2655
MTYLNYKNHGVQHSHVSDAYLHYQKARYYEFLAKQYGFSRPHPHRTSPSCSDERNAMWCFLSAATRGYSSAQFKLGQCYLNGQLGVTSNLFKAEQWLMLAARQGHTEARDELLKISTTQIPV